MRIISGMLYPANIFVRSRFKIKYVSVKNKLEAVCFENVYLILRSTNESYILILVWYKMVDKILNSCRP